MPLPDGFIRVSPLLPCQQCHKPDWCLIHKSGKSGICARVKSPHPCGAKGWSYKIKGGIDLTVVQSDETVELDTATLLRHHRCYRKALTRDKLTVLACELNVDDRALNDLRVGWCADYSAYSFPFRDATGKIVGIQFRAGARKFSLKGSRLGLFIPASFYKSHGTVYVCEGASDTAAILSLGMRAVGRAAARLGGPDIVKLLDKFPVWERGPRAVFVADRDPSNIGLDGALDIAYNVDYSCVIQPVSAKDARQTLTLGTTADHLRACVAGKVNPYWRFIDVQRGAHRQNATFRPLAPSR